MSESIAKMGYSVLTAQNGLEAVEMFSAKSPDLIMMDVRMPEMNGHEAARRMRELSETRWTPIIFLSSAGEYDDQVAGLEAGGDDYLIKPVNYSMLEAKIKAMQRIAGMHRLLRDNAEQLVRYHDRTEQEQRLAKYLMERMISFDNVGEG